MAAVAELTVRIDVPVPPGASVTLTGLTEAVRSEGETDVETEMVLANPLRLDKAMVDAPEEPAVNPKDEGFAEMVKSGEVGVVTVTVTSTECDREPLVPVTVTLYVPAELELTVSTDVADPPELRLTLLGLREAERPEGDEEAVRDTDPEKLLRLVRMMSEVAEEPVCTEMLAGLAETLKSLAELTVTEIVTECDREPLVPVTVTV